MKTKKPAPLLNPDEKHLKKWVCVQSIDTLKTLFLCKRNRLVESKKTSNNKQHIDFRVK